MFSDQIDERIKGFAYAHEPQRVMLFNQNRAIFHGRNGVYNLELQNTEWKCTCEMWGTLPHGEGGRWCRHTIAIERMLSEAAHGNILLTQAASVLA